MKTVDLTKLGILENAVKCNFMFDHPTLMPPAKALEALLNFLKKSCDRRAIKEQLESAIFIDLKKKKFERALLDINEISAHCVKCPTFNADLLRKDYEKFVIFYGGVIKTGDTHFRYLLDEERFRVMIEWRKNDKMPQAPQKSDDRAMLTRAQQCYKEKINSTKMLLSEAAKKNKAAREAIEIKTAAPVSLEKKSLPIGERLLNTLIATFNPVMKEYPVVGDLIQEIISVNSLDDASSIKQVGMATESLHAEVRKMIREVEARGEKISEIQLDDKDRQIKEQETLIGRLRDQLATATATAMPKLDNLTVIMQSVNNEFTFLKDKFESLETPLEEKEDFNVEEAVEQTINAKIAEIAKILPEIAKRRKALVDKRQDAINLSDKLKDKIDKRFYKDACFLKKADVVNCEKVDKIREKITLLDSYVKKTLNAYSLLQKRSDMLTAMQTQLLKYLNPEIIEDEMIEIPEEPPNIEEELAIEFSENAITTCDFLNDPIEADAPVLAAENINKTAIGKQNNPAPTNNIAAPTEEQKRKGTCFSLDEQKVLAILKRQTKKKRPAHTIIDWAKQLGGFSTPLDEIDALVMSLLDNPNHAWLIQVSNSAEGNIYSLDIKVKTDWLEDDAVMTSEQRSLANSWRDV
jgi:hypothetical protein